MVYAISETNIERQKALAAVCEPVTDHLLDTIPLPVGMRCLDLGCGIGETTQLLARKIKNLSGLIGVDNDPDLIATARQINAISESGMSLSYQIGDATQLEFEDGYFDFVFTRLLFLHVSQPERILAELFRVCRPSGIVIVQEADMTTPHLSYPHSWIYDRLPDFWRELFVNPQIGRRVWSMFADFGYPEANVRAESAVIPGSFIAKVQRLTMEAVQPALLEKRLIDDEELNRMYIEFHRLEAEVNTKSTSPVFFSVWAKKH